MTHYMVSESVQPMDHMFKDDTRAWSILKPTIPDEHTLEVDGGEVLRGGFAVAVDYGRCKNGEVAKGVQQSVFYHEIALQTQRSQVDLPTAVLETAKGELRAPVYGIEW